MAKKKNAEELTTLNREVLPNVNIKLTSVYGVMDIRNNQWYSEVVCKPQNESFLWKLRTNRLKKNNL